MTFWTAALYYLFRAAVVGAVLLFAGIPLPRHIFKSDRFPFKAYPFENGGNIYKYVLVHKWKDIVPDASKMLKWMTKKKFEGRVDDQALVRLIQETCVAEAVHWLLIMFVPVYSRGIPCVYAVILSCLYVLGNLVFIVIQRYNRPRFHKALEMYLAREKRKQLKKEKG